MSKGVFIMVMGGAAWLDSLSASKSSSEQYLSSPKNPISTEKRENADKQLPRLIYAHPNMNFDLFVLPEERIDNFDPPRHLRLCPCCSPGGGQ